MSVSAAAAIPDANRTYERACEGVLIADDDPMYRRILHSWLIDWGYDVTVAEDGDRAWYLLQQEHPPELLILDWLMPGVDGTELCQRLRQCRHGSYQYILLVTARDDRRDIVAGLEAGADDYLTKPFDKNELRARLRVGRRILDLQRELIHAREDLRFQATHDALTGIWNRAAVLELLHGEIERAARGQRSTGVLMVDLDHFKSVNDTYGHLTGDLVLKESAKRLQQSVRSYDFVGRYGGEEFVIVLPDCTAIQAFETAERIRMAIRSTPILAEGHGITLTASVGATAAAGQVAKSAILNVADRALYQAKNTGRDRTVVL